MKTLVYMEMKTGEVYVEEPYLSLGQVFGMEQAQKYMDNLNRNIKDNFKYTKVLLIEHTDNFYNFTHKNNHINSVIDSNGWTRYSAANHREGKG